MSSNYSFSPIDASNVHQIMSAMAAAGKEKSPVVRVWANVQTGEIQSAAPALAEQRKWEAIEISEESSGHELSIKESPAPHHELAIAQVKKAVNVLNAAREKIKASQLLDHLPDFAEFSAASELDSSAINETILSKLVLQCFGQPIALEVASAEDTKAQAELIFKYAQARLESPEALSEQEIHNIHQLLFHPKFKEASNHQMRDEYHPAFVFDKLSEALANLKAGKSMVPIREHTDSGSGEELYTSFFLQGDKDKLWVFKPNSGEVQAKQRNAGIKPGTGPKREHLACLLNYNRKYPIPYTAYVNIGGQIGSVQLFRPNCISLGAAYFREHGTFIEKLSAKQMHYILIFDIRFSNTDRHSGNILCETEGVEQLLPHAIDHGGCMSDSMEDPLLMEYLTVKKMCMEPFHAECVEFVRQLEVKHDAELMKKHGIEDGAIKSMDMNTRFLQFAVEYSAASKKVEGLELSASDIGIAIKGARNFFVAKPTPEAFKAVLDEMLQFKAKINELVFPEKIQSYIDEYIATLKEKASSERESKEASETQWADIVQKILTDMKELYAPEF